MSRYCRRTHRHLSLQVLDERRVLAAIVGSVFDDGNDSLRRDADEVGLEKRLVYVDQNNNSEMDQGERYALTDENGDFSIGNMPDGEYAVRLFNGTSNQVQTTPTSAKLLHDEVLRDDIVTALAAQALDPETESQRTAPSVLAAGSQLQTVAADGTLGVPLDLGGTVGSLSRLADGSLLALSTTSDGAEFSLVDETGVSQTLFNPPPSVVPVESFASDDVGNGIAVAQPSGAESELWAIDTSDLSVNATGVTVPAGTLATGDTTARTTDGPTRSVLSHSVLVDDGNGGTTQTLAISFWSHAGDEILNDSIMVSGASEVVAFHDEAGLLVLRSGDDLTVHDVDSANLATLYTIADTEPIAAIDNARGLIVTLSPRSFSAEGSLQDPGLRLLDSETGSLVADLAVDLSALGDLSAVSLDASLQNVMLSGASGLAQLTLRRPAAAKAEIDGADSQSLELGVRLIGDNSPPEYPTASLITVNEDETTLSPVPGVLDGVIDNDQGDQFVVLPGGPASSGVASIQLDGQMIYTPADNFAGSATVPLIVTDGRDAVEVALTIAVLPVSDPPTEIEVVIDPVPENIPPADLDGDLNPIGVINIVDADLENNFEIEVLNENRVPDERFQVINGQIVFVGPGRLDFENEWSIPLIFTVTDPDTDTTLEYATTITVTDADDPITDITPSSANVQENSPGEIITSIAVVDQDFDQIHTWSIDDDRFEVVNGELKLKDSESLDREAAETLTINITASYEDDSFTKPFLLTVLDFPEIPANFQLTDATVMELDPGAVVGEMTIAGNPAANGHHLTVNDPRFLFEDSTLRLADGVFIERTPDLDDEILLEVTATPDSSGLDGVAQQFVIAVVENDKPFHNDHEPGDVNNDGYVTARDALVIINYLNTYGPGQIGEGDPALGYDVNSDGYITSLDALLVINELNAQGGGGGTVGNEPGGEPTDRIARPQDDKPAAGSIANDSIGSEEQSPSVPQPDSMIQSPGRRESVRDQALARLSQREAEKVVSAAIDSASIDETVEMISSDSSGATPDDETSDQVLGAWEIRLLG